MTAPSQPPGWLLALVRLVAPPAHSEQAEGDVLEAWERRRADPTVARYRAFWCDLWSLYRLRGMRVAPIQRHWARGVAAMWWDLRYTVRMLRRQPLFGALLIATLSVGLAASTAIFALCDRALLRPLPYPEPERVVSIDGVGFGNVNGHPAVARALLGLSEVPNVGFFSSGGLNFGDGSSISRIRAAGVSAGFFPAIGVAPRTGRFFDDHEDEEASAVAVVGETFWRVHLGGDAAIIGKSIRLNGRAYVVTGVMPDDVTFPDHPDVWIPGFADLQMYGAAVGAQYIGRLAPGVTTADAARAVARAVGSRSRRPGADAAAVTVQSLQAELAGTARPSLLFLAGVVSLLLVATCANVAGLLLSRLRTRENELQVRVALGASRSRLARQLLVECVTLCGVGGLVGVWLALAIVRGMSRAVPELDWTTADAAMDVRFFIVAFLTGLAGAALFSAAPVAAVLRRPAAAALRDATATARIGWLRGLLVSVQIAAALVMLTATSAALGVVSRLSRVDLGFENDDAVTFELTLPSVRYSSATAVRQAARDLRSVLSRVPGVQTVGLTSLGPASKARGIGLTLARSPEEAAADLAAQRFAIQLSASPGYFKAMGIPVLAGREFVEADDRIGARALIVNEHTARLEWGSVERAAGQHLYVDSFGLPKGLYDVVGIVRDVYLRGVSSAPGAQVYFPLDVAPAFGSLSVVVAASGETQQIIDAVQARITTLDSDLPMYNPVLIRELRARYLAKQRLTLALTGAVGVIALVLCGIGLYGSLAQVVAQRTREIGIRVALGAAPRRLVRGVVLQGLGVAAAGVLAGAIGSGAAARLIARFVPALDRPSATAVALDAGVLLAVALVAAWIPARRAARVDPVIALRST